MRYVVDIVVPTTNARYIKLKSILGTGISNLGFINSWGGTGEVCKNNANGIKILGLCYFQCTVKDENLVVSVKSNLY